MWYKLPESIRIDIYHHNGDMDQDGGLPAKLDVIIAMLDDVLRKEIQMSAAMDALSAQVKANVDAEASAMVLINGLVDQIIANKEDPVALQKMADDLKASATSLSANVVANTPAA